MPPRYLNRVENVSGSVSITLPRFWAEYEQEQPLLRSSSPLTGQDYSFDQLGDAPSIKANASERVRFTEVGDPADIDVAIDALKALATGRVKIFTIGAGDDHDGSQERWAWARMDMLPSVSLGVKNRETQPVSMSFERFTNWFSVEDIGIFGEFNLYDDPEVISVYNPGNADVYNAVVTVKGPFSGLVITNANAVLQGTSTPYVLQSDSVGVSMADWIRFDAGRNAVELSSDSGATWDDDSGNFVRQAGQVRLMVFAPGANALTIDGAAACDVVVEMYGAWH